jgi:ABC-type antimicrobial peptide transport system permease subunit
VRRLVIFGGLKVVVAGVAVGIGAALLSSSLIRAVLFNVSPTDPRAIVAVAAALVAAAAVACFMPARQAARLDPAQVLRDS